MPTKQKQGQSLVMSKVGNCSTVLLLTPMEIGRLYHRTARFSESPASADFHWVEHPAAGVDGAAGGLLMQEP